METKKTYTGNEVFATSNELAARFQTAAELAGIKGVKAIGGLGVEIPRMNEKEEKRFWRNVKQDNKQS